MKMGLVSSILDGWSYEEMIDVVSQKGLSCVEAACWPVGEAERRYAGVTHIDVDTLDAAKAAHYLQYATDRNVDISALAYYPNTMDPDLEKREKIITHLYKVIDAAEMLHVNLVTTFIGRDQTKTVEDNLQLVKKVWPPILDYAKKKGVRIAIENCPMLFGVDQWPGGQNLMTTPVLFEKIFDLLPYDNLGLNFDPSHFVWQMLNYYTPIYFFKDKLFHIHFKDLKVRQRQLERVGILAYPLEYMSPKLPGLGDVDWKMFISALTDVGYDGCACIEIEDKAFEGSREKILDSITLSKRYLDQFVI